MVGWATALDTLSKKAPPGQTKRASASAAHGMTANRLTGQRGEFSTIGTPGFARTVTAPWHPAPGTGMGLPLPVLAFSTELIFWGRGAVTS